VRDTVFDHTPFLQKVIGESTPGEILKQLDEIDERLRPASAPPPA
jgi:hypothetical protein